MKVLETNQYYLALCGVLLKDKENTKDKLIRLCTNFVFFWSFLYVLLFCSAMHIHHNLTITNAMNACVGLFAGVLGFGGYIGIVANAKSIKLLIVELQKIVDNGE